MKLEVEDMAFDSVIPAVSSGKADIGVAGMTVDPDRLESVNFSDTYADASQVIIVKRRQRNCRGGVQIWKESLSVFSLEQQVIHIQVKM